MAESSETDLGKAPNLGERQLEVFNASVNNSRQEVDLRKSAHDRIS